MFKQSVLAFLFTSLLAGGALALDLQVAKAQGLVGEANTGYLGAVKRPPSAEVKSLMDGVNRQRGAKFKATAQANNITEAQVAARFYQRAVEATAAGQYYQLPSGQWVRK